MVGDCESRETSFNRCYEATVHRESWYPACLNYRESRLDACSPSRWYYRPFRSKVLSVSPILQGFGRDGCTFGPFAGQLSFQIAIAAIARTVYVLFLGVLSVVTFAADF